MRTMTTLIAFLAFTTMTNAQTDARPVVAANPIQNSYYVATPDQLIRQAVNRLTGFLIGVKEASPQAVQEFVALELAEYFDFAYMAQWAAGPYYRKLDDLQKAALTAKMKDMFLGALARNLGSLQKPLPEVVVYPARPGRTANDATVVTRVVSENMRTRINFRFYWNNGSWRVFDVAANGASAAAFYRRYFTALFRRFGPDAVLR